jgi:hypothetical protein
MGGKKPENIGDFRADELMSLPPEQFKKQIPSILSKIVSKRDKNLLVMFYPEHAHSMILPPHASIVFSELGKINHKKDLEIFIHSSGGDIHTAYKLAKLCQKRCKYIKALIPEYAKSAATLLAIGCHEIEMSLIAELGPLDPVINFEDGSRYPAFAIRDSPKVLEREIEECTDSEVRKLKAEHVLGPIAAKIDPYVLSETSAIPGLAIEYGKKLLTAVGYTKEQAERILKRLTIERGRPSHGYVIDVDEAREIGLRANEMDKETEKDCLNLLMILRTLERKMIENGHAPGSPFIFLEPPSKK